jgi:hypothetical protein
MGLLRPCGNKEEGDEYCVVGEGQGRSARRTGAHWLASANEKREEEMKQE